MGLFAISTSITPGPNTLMLLASGVNFGFRRTLPHMLGIAVGFPAMIMAIGLGLGGLFEAYPRSHVILKYVGMAYLLWLAWKVATAERAEDAAYESKPFGFFQAAAFQWVNPKAWTVSVSAIATYTNEH
jgi:threonine/homoserine/homoserine lactone efflux protein